MRTRRDTAKRRAARRQRETGAAMFVVSMTLAVLASVGLFALAAASTEVKTSGAERQATQTHYLADYGTTGVARETSTGRIGAYVQQMLAPKTVDTCVSLPLPAGVSDPLIKACRRLEMQDFIAAWSAPPTIAYGSSSGGATAPNQVGIAPGSLGTTTTVPAFFVELTSPEKWTAPARYGLNLNMCFIQVTASSIGITKPTLGGTTNYSHEDTEMQRARYVAGPTQCPW
ncbi:MAG TPA: hypothetical protein VKU41_29290 [Polyangiaceae bacterium]|nr:hypothetical protein [Polyangiaceae bacterium]